MENRIAIAKFINGDKIAHTESIWQYDYGQELKLEGLDLPSAFEVHFAKELHGNAVTSLYNSGSVLIPDQLIQTPGTLFAWVYLHDTESDGETEYTIIIDVKKRAKPSHETPTPAQQSEIEQLIATLETAVEESETNVTHYPKIEDGYWYVWDAEVEDWENTGVEATGPQGEQGPQGPEGPEGPEGPQGPAGADGYSPSASVSKSGATATITITDKNGTTTASISDGAALIDDTATAQDSTWSSSKIDSTKINKYCPTGTGYVSINRKADTSTGSFSVAIGYDGTASGSRSFAEGDRTTASGDCSHAEGAVTTASGVSSHAEGGATTASGAWSHAEGANSIAYGIRSHAEGNGTIANGDTQHVGGKYNVADTASAEIIGNGTGADARSNARTLDWNGNEKLAGKLTIGSNPTADMDVVPRKYMEQAIQDAVLSILPKKTVTGAVASFSDAQAGYPLVNLEATIVPQQAPGTPTPTNPLPISGWTEGTFTQNGANFFDEVTELGSIDITTGQNVDANNRLRSKNYLPVKGGQTYRIYLSGSSTLWMAVLTYDANKNFLANLGGKTGNSNITLDANVCYLRFYLDGNYGLTYNHDISINYPSTDTAYHAYVTPTAATAQFGQTVYGGTWKASEGKVVDGFALYQVTGANIQGALNNTYYAIASPKPDNVSGEALPLGGACDKYQYVSTYAGRVSGTCYQLNNQLIFVSDDFTTLEEANRILSEQKPIFCYKVSNPTEISVNAVNLTAQDGVNNIFADTGNSSVTYGAKIT